MIEVDPSEPRDTGDNIVIPDSQDKVQVVQTSEKPASSVLCDVSKAPVAPQDSSHTQSGHQALVPEVALQPSRVDPTIPAVSASGSPNMAPAAMETQDTNEDESLPPGQSTPVNKVNTDTQTDQSPLTLAKVLDKGLIEDADWMKTLTVVMRVQRQKFFITVTRDQMMTDLQTMGITRDKLIGIGESGSGEWDIYCLHERTPPYLSEQKAYQYAGKYPTELFLWERQTSVIRVHWLPLRVNNSEVEDWVHNFSDEINDIFVETSVATQAEGLITGIRRIRCILREGVARTDMPYKESIMDEDGSLYAVLISVEGRLPKCLKCEKLGHIHRDCKAKKCLGCYHMTDEHVTATCPYKGQYSTRVGNPPAQQQTYRQTHSVRLQHPPGASRPSRPRGPNITCYQEAGSQALGVTEKQLATDLEVEPFTEVVGKRRRRNQRKSSIGSQENTPVTPPEKSSTSMLGPPQGETPEPEPFPDLHLSTGVASSGKTPYVQQVHVPKRHSLHFGGHSRQVWQGRPPTPTPTTTTTEETSTGKAQGPIKTPSHPQSPPKNSKINANKGPNAPPGGKVMASGNEKRHSQASLPKAQRDASARLSCGQSAEASKAITPVSATPPAHKPNTPTNTKWAATVSSSSGSYGTQSRDLKKYKTK